MPHVFSYKYYPEFCLLVEGGVKTAVTLFYLFTRSFWMGALVERMVQERYKSFVFL